MNKVVMSYKFSVVSFRKNRNNLPLNSGLTLIEILVSLAILSIGILAIAHLFPVGLKSSERAVSFTRAYSYLQDTLEKLRYAAGVYDAEDVTELENTFNTTNGPDGIFYMDPTSSHYDNRGYYELWYRYRINGPDSPYQANPGKFTTYNDPQTDQEIAWSYLLFTEESNLDTNIIQKVYISIYWKESGGVRADTTPLYIANIYHKEFGSVLP